MTMPPLIRILDRGSMIFLITLGILTILVPFLNLAFPPSSALHPRFTLTILTIRTSPHYRLLSKV